MSPRTPATTINKHIAQLDQTIADQSFPLRVTIQSAADRTYALYHPFTYGDDIGDPLIVGSYALITAYLTGYRHALLYAKPPAPTKIRRITFDYDPEPDLTDPAGAPLPGSRKTYEENPITPNGGPALTYQQYCKYYGNPDRHVVLMHTVQEQCTASYEDQYGKSHTCKHWYTIDSCYGHDFMDDDPIDIGSFTHQSQLRGYQRELAKEAGLPE